MIHSATFNTLNFDSDTLNLVTERGRSLSPLPTPHIDGRQPHLERRGGQQFVRVKQTQYNLDPMPHNKTLGFTNKPSSSNLTYVNADSGQTMDGNDSQATSANLREHLQNKINLPFSTGKANHQEDTTDKLSSRIYVQQGKKLFAFIVCILIAAIGFRYFTKNSTFETCGDSKIYNFEGFLSGRSSQLKWSQRKRKVNHHYYQNQRKYIEEGRNVSKLQTIDVTTLQCQHPKQVVFRKMGYYRPPFDMAFLQKKLPPNEINSGKSFINKGSHNITNPFLYAFVYVQVRDEDEFLTGVSEVEVLCRKSGMDSERGFEVVLLNNERNPTQIFVSEVSYIRDVQCCNPGEQALQCQKSMLDGETCNCDQ